MQFLRRADCQDPGFDFEFEPLAFGLDVFDAIFRGIKLCLRHGGAGEECFTFGRDLGEFLLNAMNFPVAILQNQKFFNCFLH